MKINLFCLPFAGGSKYSYNPYVQYVPENVKLIPLDIPGRGGRFTEPLLVEADKIVEDIFAQVKDQLNGKYAFYGHSMGGLLAYLTVKKILKENMNAPLHLFITGRKAPSFAEPFHRYMLSQEDFRKELKKMGGSPDEILENEDLMEMFEPILRADFQAIETYQYQKTEPFNIPITVAIGSEEVITFEDAQAWQQETLKPVDVRVMKGNHFFIYDHAPEIMKLIGEKLR